MKAVWHNSAARPSETFLAIEFQRQQSSRLLRDLRTELYQIVYEKPIYPKNLYLKREPMKHAEYQEKVTKKQIELMHERDIWKKPER